MTTLDRSREGIGAPARPGAGEAPTPQAAARRRRYGKSETHHSRTAAAFEAIGRFAVRWRYLVIAAWVIAAGLCAAYLPSLGTAVKGQNSEFLPASTPSERAATLGRVFQPADTMVTDVVVSTSDGPLTPADFAAVGVMAQRLEPVGSVKAVQNLGPSQDGRADLVDVFGSSDVQADPTVASAFIGNLRSTIARSGLPPGLHANVTGVLATFVDSAASDQRQANLVQYGSVLFIVVLLFLIFRSFLAPIVMVFPAVLVVTLAGPIIAEAAKWGMQVSQITQILLIVLVIGAGVDYGLFLVFRVREELRNNMEPRDAIVHALARVGESITFSAGTVIAALLSLLVATFGLYQSLGGPLAIGIALMLAAGLTLLPALLAILGRAVFWPSRTRAGAAQGGLWGRIAARIVRRPAATLLIGVALFGTLSVAAFAYKPGGFGDSTGAPPGTDAAKGDTVLAAHFRNTSSNPTEVVLRFPVSVWGDLQKVADATTLLEGTGRFRSVEGPTDPNGKPADLGELARLHAAIGSRLQLTSKPPPGVPLLTYEDYLGAAHLISPDGRTILMITRLTAGDPAGTAAQQDVPALRTAVGRVAHEVGAVDNGVVGQAAFSYDVSALSSADLHKVVPVAILVIGLLLAIVIRSLVAPLYLIVSVALSFLSALGVAVIVFMKIGGEGGLVFFLPFLMFVFLLALGEDYNILVMSRIREEAHDHPLREAITRAIAVTGTTVTSAGLVLAGSFTVLTFAAGRGNQAGQIRDIGVGLAVGILMDTFLVRTLLVPSVVALLGRWNWWPSRLARDGIAPGVEGNGASTGASNG